MFITIPVSHSFGIWFLSIILLNSSNKCIFNSFPPNFHTSIGNIGHTEYQNKRYNTNHKDEET